ncbi:hypothetical protein GCM10022224_082770 [Nonomuraea antimicrobica]|uniref:Uncharacterized protein n=1 Tax=Nonomuraea antimicrobica TaxID=561173 RepID=A0ABP7DID9_9ACTN
MASPLSQPGLLDLEVPPTLSERNVEHSDIEVTITIYTHTSLAEKGKALGKLGDLSVDRPAPTHP